jgi:hypothetical protein
LYIYKNTYDKGEQDEELIEQLQGHKIEYESGLELVGLKEQVAQLSSSLVAAAEKSEAVTVVSSIRCIYIYIYIYIYMLICVCI